MYSKKIQFITQTSSTLIFYKIILLVMNMLIFNFQNMMGMHKQYAYQISNSIAYQKKLIRVQFNLLKQN
jgi:hypothetical protein